MANTDDTIDRNSLPESNIYMPVSTDKSKLEWDGNDATILGLLYETGRYYRRKGLFQPLLSDRAVALSNGRLAVEHPSAVHFITGTITENRSFDDPCPPTVDRLQEHNDEVGLGTRAGTVQKPLATVPAEHQSTIIVAKHSVAKEDSLLLHSLSYVFGSAEPSENLMEDADGSGLELLRLLRDRGKRATPRDKALVTTKFASLVRDGVKGELTLGSFTSFLKAYKSARRNIAPGSRPNDEAEIEMITVIAIKDSASRELFELKIATSPPTDLDSAAKILTDMLRGRVRCEEIDEITSGRAELGLSAATQCSAPGCEAVKAALITAGISPTAFNPSQLSALVSALAPADPRKLSAGRDKDKVKVPRDSDGKPNKWVEGMALCRCGVNGGKHLFKDCPKKKEKEKKTLAAAKAALAAEAKESAKGAAAAAGAKDASGTATGPTEDQLRALLSALFTGSTPTVNLSPGEHGGLTTGGE
jgi:hypothetical protein